MKKVISVMLVALMLATLLGITAYAKEDKPFGTVVELPYTQKAPDMNESALDSSWGKPLVHIDKKSPNTGILQPDERSRLLKDDLSFDLYGMWDDSAIYLCYVCPDTEMYGGVLYYTGDNLQMVLFPGIIDISYCNGVSTGWTDVNQYMAYDWVLSLGPDDASTDGSDNALEEGAVFVDEKNNQLIFKFKCTFSAIGFSKNDKIGDGTYISFDAVRADLKKDMSAIYIEWGDFYNSQKGWNTSDTALYLKNYESPKTTTANTFKLVGKNTVTPSTPTTPTTPVEKPSGWAEAEVNDAIKAGLVPAELQKNYTAGISRADLSKMLSALLDKVYGKAPQATDAKFTDTTDIAVLRAANLGIINGYKQNDGSYAFKPNNTLKRSEMSAIINRVAKLCGKTTTGYDKEVKFTDTVNHWCKAELGYPVHMGIVKGTSATAFSPENTLTVEQTIMMIYRTYTALK